MTFKLSQRSLNRLEGVHPDLVAVVKRAILITPIDFGVHEGMRTKARQRKLVDAKASKTMNSRHLNGHAVDLLAYIGRRHSYDWPLYYQIAEVMRYVAMEQETRLDWGAAWGHTLNDYPSARDASDAYLARKVREKKKPYMDGPHFQLPWKEYP